MSTTKVPSSEHYRPSYLGQDFERLLSYKEQLGFVANKNYKNILIIGKGDGFVGNVLKDMGFKVITIDIAYRLCPDIVANVKQIPFSEEAFDVVLCCQVLEHLPFKELKQAVSEIQRVANKRIVLSVPDQRKFFSLRVTALRFGFEWQLSVKSPFVGPIPRERVHELGHYWEVGYDGYTFGKVEESIIGDGHWKCVDKKRVFDFSWHLFFILEK